jgi:hypothetical protein
MTPKEKAEELVNRYMNLNKVKLSDYSVIYTPTAKQCALIAIDEMIKQQQIQFDEMIWSCVGYWKEVKEEILKL